MLQFCFENKIRFDYILQDLCLEINLLFYLGYRILNNIENIYFFMSIGYLILGKYVFYLWYIGLDWI